MNQYTMFNKKQLHIFTKNSRAQLEVIFEQFSRSTEDDDVNKSQNNHSLYENGHNQPCTSKGMKSKQLKVRQRSKL